MKVFASRTRLQKPDGEARNLLSALSRPEVGLDKLTKEVGWPAWWALSPIYTNSGFESIPVGLRTEGAE